MRLMFPVILVLACAGGVALGVAGQEKEPPVVCGFRNTSHTGLCEERTPYVQGKKLDALCQPILDCLNNTQCIKNYCGSTTVRRGWVLESATRAR